MITVNITFSNDMQVLAVDDILDERNRQDEQWGEQNHHPAYWLAILGKQVGQLGSAVLDREWAADIEKGTASVRKEAVQAAAVALAIIECIDAGEMPTQLTTSQPADPRQRAKALGRGDEALRYEDAETRPHWSHTCPCSNPAYTHNYATHDLPVAPTIAQGRQHSEEYSIGEPGSEPCS